MVYPYLKLHNLFYSNGLAIWTGFPDITHIKKIMVDNRPFWRPWPSFCPILPNFEAIRAISEMDVWYIFWSKTLKNVEWIALTRKCVVWKWPQVGHFEFYHEKIFMVYPYLELHILLYSSGLTIRSVFSDITHIREIMSDNRPFWPPWPSFCPNLAQFRAYSSYLWIGYMV